MKKGLVFLIMVLILLAGCSYISNLRPGPDQNIILPRGIGINFVDGFPPSKIIEGVPFNIKINVINYGAKDADIELAVSDSIGGGYGGIESILEDSVSLEGSFEDKSSGFVFDKKEVLFNDEVVYDNVEEGMTATFIASALFDYDYRSNAVLCINGYTTRSDKKRCADSEIISGKLLGQDAARSPIAVTKVEKRSSVTESGDANVLLDITIANAGNGELAELESDGNELRISVSLGDFDIKCSNNKIKFKNDVKERTITCNAKGNIVNEFLQAPLIISYNYKYKVTSYSDPIKIMTSIGSD